MRIPGKTWYFSLSVLSCVIIVSFITRVSSTECSNLQAYYGSLEVTDAVCRSVSRGKSLSSVKTNSCPLPKTNPEGDGVQRPSSSYVQSTHKVYEGSKRPGLVIQWKSPVSRVARTHMSGFLLQVKSKDKAQNFADIVCIDHSKYAEQLNFSYTIDRISVIGGREYDVDVYSLPQPNSQEKRKDLKNSVSSSVITKRVTRTGSSNPSDWETTFNCQPGRHAREINVTVQYPPKESNMIFTQYEVKLLVCKRTTKKCDDHNKTTLKPSANDTERTVILSSDRLLLTDYFKVSVQPIDEHRYVHGKCQCYKIFGSYHTCVVSCARSESRCTEYDDVPSATPTNKSMSSSTSRPKVKSTLIVIEKSPPYDPTPEYSSSNPQDIVVPTLVSVFAFSVFVFVGVIFITRKCIKDATERTIITKLQGLPRKRIFLLYSTDHEFHRALVKKFIGLLETYFMCDVVEPSRSASDQTLGGSAAWLANELCRCDFIVFFDSMGAHRRIEAFAKSDSRGRFIPVVMGPERDLFHLGLTHIYNNMAAMSRQLIVISFTEEFSKSRLFTSAEYLLPKHLPQLVKTIHRLDDTEEFPLLQKHLQTLPGGNSLLTAIRDVTSFEKKHPDWFLSYFKLETPKTDVTVKETTESDSGQSPGYIQRSVTPPVLDNSKELASLFDFPDPTSPQFHGHDFESCITVQTNPLPHTSGVQEGSNDYDVISLHGQMPQTQNKEMILTLTTGKDSNETDKTNIGELKTGSHDKNQRMPSYTESEIPSENIDSFSNFISNNNCHSREFFLPARSDEEYRLECYGEGGEGGDGTSTWTFHESVATLYV